MNALKFRGNAGNSAKKVLGYILIVRRADYWQYIMGKNRGFAAKFAIPPHFASDLWSARVLRFVVIRRLSELRQRVPLTNS